jgi:S-adenosylmethionine:tRNA ribosyltransferase-isomerase
MKTSQFDYNLPEELIAQTPLEARDASRLLVVDPTLHGNETPWLDAKFAQLPNLLATRLPKGEGPLIIVNESRVLPARVRIRRKTGARGEVFLLEPGKKEAERHSCLLRPLKKLRVGELLLDDATGTVELFRIESLDPPTVSATNIPLAELLERFGEMPLPPYIVRDPERVGTAYQEIDRHRYQTVYATQGGSVASSTAGLHFSDAIMNACKANRCDFAAVTLHIGLGTFLPVTAEQVDDHPMHKESYSLGLPTVTALCDALEQNRPILFVGTTSIRSVESFLRMVFPDENPRDGGLRRRVAQEARAGTLRNRLMPLADRWFSTNLFIRPEGTAGRILPACGNAILTNFHQPMSTLVMLVAALLGYDCWRQTYEHAVAERYRFLSYGDSSLLIFHSGDPR